MILIEKPGEKSGGAFVIRYNYRDYQNLLDSFDFKEDPFNPRSGILQEYVNLLEEFNPDDNPPPPTQKKQYIKKYVIPILQEYCRDFEAVLEIDEKPNGIFIDVLSKCIVIDEQAVFKSILLFATWVIVKQHSDGIIVKLYFATS